MQVKKLIGITLMTAAVLLQVGYATTATMQTVSTKEFKVKFEDKPRVTSDQYMQVSTQVEDGKVSVVTQNLYPGARFGVVSTIKNTGEKDAEIVSVVLEEVTREGNSHELYKQLEGYKENGESTKTYNEYLEQLYKGYILESGEAMEIILDMGLSPEVTDLQNAQAEFDLIVQFAQPEPGSGGGGNPDGGGNEGEELPDQELPDEEIPGGGIPEVPGEDEEIEILDEEIAGGSIPKLPDEKLPGDNNEIELTDESIPAGAIPVKTNKGVLPQTGGISPILVYGVGVVLLGSGLVLYKKKS